MGVAFDQLVPLKPISLDRLRRKVIAIDAYNTLYQFLRTMPVLTDRAGRLTTHLVGLFFRTTRLLSHGIRLCYVFDGPALEIGRYKKLTREIPRPRITDTITQHVVASSMQLLELLGIPVIQAPSEAEAQAAWMARQGDVWAVASQDYDCLIFGAPRMIKNLTFAKYRRLPKGGYVMIGVYLVELKALLARLGISARQLVALALLCGTDWNPNPPGIGPKRALELIKRYSDFNELFAAAGWSWQYSWKEVYGFIQSMPVTNRYRLRWREPDRQGLLDFLVRQHDFDKKRVETALAKCLKI